MADINNPLGKPKEQGERPLTKGVIGAADMISDLLISHGGMIRPQGSQVSPAGVQTHGLQGCPCALTLVDGAVYDQKTVGASHIAVELAGISDALGMQTHLPIRMLTPWMEKAGASVPCQTHITRVEGTQGGPLVVYINNRDELESDVLQWAIDRRAITKKIGLEGVGVRTDEKGHVIPDDDHVSSVSNITSIGEAQGKAELTPFNTAADRHLGNRLIGLPERLPIDTNGLTEKQARKKYGNENIKIFKASFRSRYLCIVNEDPELIVLELIGAGPEERAVKTEGGAQDLRLS
ncbi:hypothetical protein EV122DRAFT_284210 [Schizophyllum commune]